MGPYTVGSIQKAKENFNGDLEEFQNETTVDLLFIAIRGQRQQHCMTNTPDCVYNIFPAGGNAICYMPQFLYGNNTYNCKPDPSVVTHSTWNALNYPFGSAAPYKLGKNMAMKITTQPCGKDESSDGTDYWSLINDTNALSSSLASPSSYQVPVGFRLRDASSVECRVLRDHFLGFCSILVWCSLPTVKWCGGCMLETF